MKETMLIEIYSFDSKCCEIAKEEIIGTFPETDSYYAERDWYISCEFLERFTGENDISKFDLYLNIHDYCKNIDVFMIIMLFYRLFITRRIIISNYFIL